MVSLDKIEQATFDIADSSARSPEEEFDAVWIHHLLEQGIGALEGELKSNGKPAYFQVFSSYCLDPLPPEGSRDSPTYGEVAKKLGIRDTDVRNYLSFCRIRLRGILSEMIRETVGSPEAIEIEMNEILNG